MTIDVVFYLKGGKSAQCKIPLSVWNDLESCTIAFPLVLREGNKKIGEIISWERTDNDQAYNTNQRSASDSKNQSR